MHRAVTLAALDSGRHVLCQARMANDSAEARDMLAASQRHSNLVCQLVPSSGTYKNRPSDTELARRRTSRRRAVGRGANAAAQLRELRRRARLAPRRRVQRHQRAQRRRHLRIRDALARPRQSRDGHDARADTDAERRARRNARREDPGPRRGALRARERRARAHEVQRDDGAIARQRDLDLRQRGHDPHRQRSRTSSSAGAATRSSRRIRTRPKRKRTIASRRSS